MQSGGPVRHCDGDLRAAEVRELVLELRDTRAHAPPARPHDLLDNTHDFVVDVDV